VTTHHAAGRFRSVCPKKVRFILYPHETAQGQRQAMDLAPYPKARAYLETHRSTLEARTYLLEGGRRWYELWVPQDPGGWAAPKLVFRDISQRPTFWLDLDGTIVNGDCYWLTCDRHGQEDLLWLAAAVANSTFAEAFYDHRFNNKLYSGRRRFITQYVEQFPLPNPETPLVRGIIGASKAIYDAGGSADAQALEAEIDRMVWEAFGLEIEEVRR
jgi:adenine-specific DNA-methyltransferase